MSWSSWIRSLYKAAGKKQSKPRKRATFALEHLEERLVPYSVTGNAWPNPQLITISFVPDGTPLSSAVGASITSNLFSSFNAKFGSAAAWQNQILKAAQVWAQQTNINFSLVSDNGASSGSGSYQQGNPGFGDIRIGGYGFGNSTLATAYQPPQVNNYSIAGDIAFNTGQTWNIGSTYDLFTVAAHEIGHALGMDHSSAGTNAIMYPSYTGIKNALSTDDIAGIRNIYSSNAARTADAYDASAGNNTVTTATNINSLINATSLTALASKLDVTTTSDADWYTFTAPAGTTGTMTVQVQSQGLSLLSPKETVYAADGSTVLGTASGLNKYGTTLDVSVSGVSAGQQFYVKVQGADTTAFSTGAYALGLNFGSKSMPVAAAPNTQAVNGATPSGGGGIADNPAGGDKLLGSTALITGISPDNGSSNNDGVTSVSRISFSGTGPAANSIQIYQGGMNGEPDQLIGSALTVGTIWSFDYTNHFLADGSYLYYTRAVPLLGLGKMSNLSTTYTVVIDTTVPPKPVVSGFSPDTGVIGDGLTNSQAPTISGIAEANSTVTLYRSGQVIATLAATSSGSWSFTDHLGPFSAPCQLMLVRFP